MAHGRLIVTFLLLVLVVCTVTSCKKAVDKQVETGTEVIGEIMKGEARSMQSAAQEAGEETYNEMKDAGKASVEDIKSRTDEVVNEAKEATKDAGEKVKGAFNDAKKLFGK